MIKYLRAVVFGVAAFCSISSEVRAAAENHPITAVTKSEKRDDFAAQLAEAWKLYQERKYDEAIKLCEKLAKIKPTDNRPYAIAGVAHMAQWKMEEASALLALAIKFSPANPVLHFTKARADRFRNAREEGLVSVRKAIELRADYAEAYLLLGDLLGIGGKNYSEQISAFRKSIELKPDLFEAYKQLGMVLAVSGDAKGAEEIYRKALARDPKKEAGFFDLGRLLVKQNRLMEARKLWEDRPAAKDNTFPNFVTVLERAEKKENAKKNYEANPNDPESIVQMGLDDHGRRLLGRRRAAGKGDRVF